MQHPPEADIFCLPLERAVSALLYVAEACPVLARRARLARRDGHPSASIVAVLAKGAVGDRTGDVAAGLAGDELGFDLIPWNVTRMVEAADGAAVLAQTAASARAHCLPPTGRSSPT